jgi:hypothetical protein
MRLMSNAVLLNFIWGQMLPVDWSAVVSAVVKFGCIHGVQFQLAALSGCFVQFFIWFQDIDVDRGFFFGHKTGGQDKAWTIVPLQLQAQQKIPVSKSSTGNSLHLSHLLFVWGIHDSVCLYRSLSVSLLGSFCTISCILHRAKVLDAGVQDFVQIPLVPIWL